MEIMIVKWIKNVIRAAQKTEELTWRTCGHSEMVVDAVKDNGCFKYSGFECKKHLVRVFERNIESVSFCRLKGCHTSGTLRSADPWVGSVHEGICGKVITWPKCGHTTGEPDKIYEVSNVDVEVIK